MRAACLTRLFCRKLFPSGALHCEPSAAIQRELLTCGVSVQEGNLVQLHNAGLSAEVAEERGSGGVGVGWGATKGLQRGASVALLAEVFQVKRL